MAQDRVKERKEDNNLLILRAISKLTDSIDNLSSNLNLLTTRIKHIENDITGLKEQHTNTKEAVDDTLSLCTQNAEIMDSAHRLTNIIINEKKTNEVKERCITIKQSLSLIWQETLNKRKQACWNAIHNSEKANLYEEWINKSPNFIPLKYRPKKHENELPEITTRQISEAKFKYKNDVDNMRTYAQRHLDKTIEMDEKMARIIDHSSTSEEETSLMDKWWANDVQRNSTISLQLWQKRKKFLERKKNEEEINGDHQLTDRPWQKTVKSNYSENKHVITEKTRDYRKTRDCT